MRHAEQLRRIGLVGVVVSLGALGACCLDDPEEARASPPDHVCQTGHEQGYDIAIWTCDDGQRRVAYRQSSGFGFCSDLQQESAPCGDLTEFERTSLTDEEREACGAAPAASGGW